ncbi:hypothetical protein QR680_003820 [Steinernema hermaphroditum]|uniref:Uncharacterized protein n=1 Tax=Steinernema hermaphroditum TaxID=289476 RepID=A0AA39HNY6_9BILA|nr:hypothetical protein QR680_003820 [Steinernema hermaphroditum]
MLHYNFLSRMTFYSIVHHNNSTYGSLLWFSVVVLAVAVAFILWHFRMEMRLTIVCLMNLVPPTIVTIIDFTWQDRGTVGSFIYALLTIGDNCINSVVLPMFSLLLRESIKKKVSMLMAPLGLIKKKDNKVLFETIRKSGSTSMLTTVT